jgi:hypothetical protein
MFAGDPASAKKQQVDIEDFYNNLPACLREALGLVHDYTSCAALNRRRVALASEGRPEPCWSTWGKFGETEITPILVKTIAAHGDNGVLMNHPQGIQNFPRLRF